MDSNDDKKIVEIKDYLKEILRNDFTIFVKDMYESLKYNSNINYNLKNAYNNALNYLLNKCFINRTKKEELEILLDLLNKSNYEELFFSKYNNLEAIKIIQDILVYYLVSVYSIDAFDNGTIDNNIYSLILLLCHNNNINIDMIPTEEMMWLHKAYSLLEIKVIDESTEELTPSEIKEHINNLIEEQPLLLSDYRSSSYAVCIGVLSYLLEKII